MLQTNSVSETVLNNSQTFPDQIKKCWKCGLTKPISDFYKNKSKHDGLQDICKNCNHTTCKKFYKENPEKLKAKHQRIKERNIKKINEGILPKPNKTCYRCKVEKPISEFYKCLSRFDGYQSACKQCNRELDKERYKTNPSSKNNSTKKWRKKNPLAVIAMKANRRAREKSAIGSFDKKTIESLYIKQKGSCACCGVFLDGIFQVDHIIPLTRGGSNLPENLQLLTPLCNQSKGAKTMDEFMQIKMEVLNGTKN